MKIDLNSFGKIDLVCGIIVCLYGNKVANLFEINPITVIFCDCPEMKNFRPFKKHPGPQQRYKMIQR